MKDEGKFKSQTIKCTNCGATSYEQKSRGVYKCNYCGANFKYKKEVNADDSFAENISLKEEEIYYIQEQVSTEEFLKKAKMYLALKENVPADILTSSFGDVKVEYGIYVVANVEYNPVDYARKEERKGELFFPKRRVICERFGDDGAEDYETALLEHLDYYEGVDGAHRLTKAKKKRFYDLLPTEDQARKLIEEMVISQKEVCRQQERWGSGVIEHSLYSTEIYVVPEYVLEYTYKDEVYKIVSLANELNFFGTFPDGKEEIDKPIKKIVTPMNIISITASAISILFAFLAYIIRQQYLTVVVFTLMAIAIAMYFVNLSVNKFITKKTKQKVAEEHAKKLEEYCIMQNIELTLFDKDYIASLKRWC